MEPEQRLSCVVLTCRIEEIAAARADPDLLEAAGWPASRLGAVLRRVAATGLRRAASERWRRSASACRRLPLSPNSSRSLPPGRVDRLLIDKNCIDDATHLDQLAANPGCCGRSARSAAPRRPGRGRPRPPSVETGAPRRRPPSGRDRRRSLRSRRTSAVSRILHGVLQRPALAACNTW